MWYGVDTWWSPGVAEGLQVAKWLKFDIWKYGEKRILPLVLRGVYATKISQGHKYEFTDLVIQNLNRV